MLFCAKDEYVFSLFKSFELAKCTKMKILWIIIIDSVNTACYDWFIS